jgi:hypothetical protein
MERKAAASTGGRLSEATACESVTAMAKLRHFPEVERREVLFGPKSLDRIVSVARWPVLRLPLRAELAVDFDHHTPARSLQPRAFHLRGARALFFATAISETPADAMKPRPVFASRGPGRKRGWIARPSSTAAARKAASSALSVVVAAVEERLGGRWFLAGIQNYTSRY